LDDVLAVRNRRLSHERNRVQPPARSGHLEQIVRVQGRVIPERFDEPSAAHLPATAQRAVDVEVQLLVLHALAVNELLVLPDAVDDDVARHALQERAGLSIRGMTRVDIRMHDPGSADEAALRLEVVRDAYEQAAQSPHAVLDVELTEPERRGCRLA